MTNAALMLLGLALVTYGVWVIFAPAVPIVVGAAMFWLGVPRRA